MNHVPLPPVMSAELDPLLSASYTLLLPSTPGTRQFLSNHSTARCNSPRHYQPSPPPYIGVCVSESDLNKGQAPPAIRPAITPDSVF